MLIVNQKKDRIVNADNMSNIDITPDGVCIKFITKNDKCIKLGEYGSYEVSKAVLEKLYRNICTVNVFEMPSEEEARILNLSKTMYDKERCSTGKKTVRRGGS